MKKFSLTLAFIALLSTGYSQFNSGVKFNKLVHDFGNVKEESEKVSTVFSFRNISDKPIYITKVETSCGCTTPEYTKDTIQPGDTGFVKAIYETRGRVGDFHKNLYVHFNVLNFYQSLIISGYVIAEANLAGRPDSYGTTYSNLAFTSTIAEFPDLLNTEKKSYVIKAYNYMGYPIRIYEVSELPAYMSVDIGDSLINVKDSIKITVTVDGSKMERLGENRMRLAFLTDDPGGSLKFLHVFVDLKEDFSGMSKKEKMHAPVVKLNPDSPLDLGKHTAGEKFSRTIQVSNTGKSTLKIRSVVPNCSCITYAMAQTEIEPGQSANLVITVDTVNQSIAGHTKFITIHTNDPNNSVIKFKVILDISY